MVSTAEKLPSSDGLAGGFLPDSAPARCCAAPPGMPSPVDRAAPRRVDGDGMLLGCRAAAGRHCPAPRRTCSDAAPASADVDRDPTGTFSTSVASSGLTAVHLRDGADDFLGPATSDPRIPDVASRAAGVRERAADDYAHPGLVLAQRLNWSRCVTSTTSTCSRTPPSLLLALCNTHVRTGPIASRTASVTG